MKEWYLSSCLKLGRKANNKKKRRWHILLTYSGAREQALHQLIYQKVPEIIVVIRTTSMKVCVCVCVCVCVFAAALQGNFSDLVKPPFAARLTEH